MNKPHLYLICLVFISFSVQAQILNGGFEQWISGEPANWVSNNIDEAELTASPITQSSFVHSGSSALKGEVVGVIVQGQELPYAPHLQSGNMSVAYFPYSGKPDTVSGYYNFQSVGGDGFIANVFLLKSGNLVAVSGVVNYSSTGAGYHPLKFYMNYLDTVSIPDAIQIIFQIEPAPGEKFANIGSTFYIDDFPKITLIKPSEEPVVLEKKQELGTEQLVFIAGETDTIKWDGGGVLNVDIKYSIDDGTTYQQIVGNYPADSSRYFWAVPGSLLTRKAKIKVIETQDKNNEIKSINFTIKPWQLSRIDANNKIELFEPNQDGWNFDNRASNVWPQSWWQQFNYSGTDPVTKEDYPWWFPFINAANSVFPDWPLFVDVFGEENCYIFGYSYRSEATTHWNGLWAGIAHPWAGSCAGFAVTSLLGFYHKDAFLAKFPEVGSFSNLYNLTKNNDTRYAINNIYSHQFGQEVRIHRRASLSKTPQELLSELKKMLSKENGDGRPLDFYNNIGSGGHAVVPYKLKRVLGPTSNFNVYVYDSNAPGSENQRILIDSIDNQWEDLTGLGWGRGNSRCFLERESADFLSTPTLPYVSFSSFLSKQSLGDNSRMTVYNTSQAEVLYTSSRGQNIGYQDSVAFSYVDDGVPIIPLIGRVHPPIGYDLPLDSYSVQLSNFTGSSSYVFLMTDSTIYNYRRHDANVNESDNLKFADGLGIENPDLAIKNLNLETVIEGNSSEKVFLIDNINISQNDSIHISEKDRQQLLLNNYGVGKNYDLEIRSASDNGALIFNHNGIRLEDNSTHQIVPDWNDLAGESVKILVDLGNNGTIDDSIFISNETTDIKNSFLSGVPKDYNLYQNYPNPFNPTTTIKYDLPKRSFVTLKVYNILGEEVATLVNGVKQAGSYSVVFNASSLPSGVYIYTLATNEFVSSKKMLIIK